MLNLHIHGDDPIATAAPELYGHFAEHIGGVIYDGIWVGRDSKVPNINGFRKEIVEKLRAIHAPVVRWPGGCFAEIYDWRDGIGPVEERPTRINWWWKNDGRYEPNTVGTHEFCEFCQLIGAEPYFAANITEVSDEEYERLLGRPLPKREQTEELNLYDTVSRFREAKSPVARFFCRCVERSIRRARKKGDPAPNTMFLYDIPIRGMAQMSGGLITRQMARDLVYAVNGHTLWGLGRFFRNFFRGRKQQKAFWNKLQQPDGIRS